MEFLTAENPEEAALQLQAEMEQFGRDKGQPVKISQLGWDNIWRELVNVGIYRRGPDLAEIGSTWLDSLVAMQSLNSFSARDVSLIGGKEIFISEAWRNVALLGDQNDVWGIPFRADTRVIFYWKDQFAKAGVDPQATFSHFDNIYPAFVKLQEAGIPAWIAPTNSTHNTVYAISSWIWGAGGEFLTADAKKTAFGEPAARRGVQAYFDLLRFVPKQTSPFSDHDAIQLFFSRKAASIVAGPWLLMLLRQRPDAADLLSQLGVVPLPGPAFVGGTLLVVWKHSKYLFEPVDLIRRLTDQEFQAKYCQVSGLLPVRRDLWNESLVQGDVYLSMFDRAIRGGRGLHPIPLWGMIEDHLSNTLGAIWRDLYALNKPGQQLAQLSDIVGVRLDALALTLNMTLSVSNEPRNNFDDDEVF